MHQSSSTNTYRRFANLVALLFDSAQYIIYLTLASLSMESSAHLVTCALIAIINLAVTGLHHVLNYLFCPSQPRSLFGLFEFTRVIAQHLFASLVVIVFVGQYSNPGNLTSHWGSFIKDATIFFHFTIRHGLYLLCFRQFWLAMAEVTHSITDHLSKPFTQAILLCMATMIKYTTFTPLSVAQLAIPTCSILCSLMSYKRSTILWQKTLHSLTMICALLSLGSILSTVFSTDKVTHFCYTLLPILCYSSPIINYLTAQNLKDSSRKLSPDSWFWLNTSTIFIMNNIYIESSITFLTLSCIPLFLTMIYSQISFLNSLPNPRHDHSLPLWLSHESIKLASMLILIGSTLLSLCISVGLSLKTHLLLSQNGLDVLNSVMRNYDVFFKTGIALILSPLFSTANHYYLTQAIGRFVRSSKRPLPQCLWFASYLFFGPYVINPVLVSIHILYCLCCAAHLLESRYGQNKQGFSSILACLTEIAAYTISIFCAISALDYGILVTLIPTLRQVANHAVVSYYLLSPSFSIATASIAPLSGEILASCVRSHDVDTCQDHKEHAQAQHPIKLSA
ncbi:MAG: hypothetical protein VXY77_03695 [Pseudomonadota bacterium]|nr:hypothetical protein [Pseudomonadota bacterium]